jgi:hypothetical protein
MGESCERTKVTGEENGKKKQRKKDTKKLLNAGT